MKKTLLLLLTAFMFLGCKNPTETPEQKKTEVEKKIDITFSGEILKQYSDGNGNHPFNVNCDIRTFKDCPELIIYYRFSEEGEWEKSSATFQEVSKTRVEMHDQQLFYPKKSIYYRVEMNGEKIASFGKWLPKDGWYEEYEAFYTVYE